MGLKILMLGWEFPPFITGGLGTACHGLTRALDAAGADVTFVLPRPVSPDAHSHVHILSPSDDPAPDPVEPPSVRRIRRSPALHGAPFAQASAHSSAHSGARTHHEDAVPAHPGQPARVGFLGVSHSAPDAMPSVYATGPHGGTPASSRGSAAWRRAAARLARATAAGHAAVAEVTDEEQAIMQAIPEAEGSADHAPHAVPATGADPYGGDLMLASERYARFCLRAARGLAFDVIHAHDWITYPAGMALARLTGRPLVVHVHATEFDRSGDHVNEAVYSIERRGMHAAVRVVTVSMLTRNVCINRYGVPPEKIDVIYNGVDLEPSAYGIRRIERNEKIVLYFGRITMQKGPEYFVRAAKRVLDVMPDVRFIVAGNGDQATRMIEMAAQLGIGPRMTFTGFLRGRDIPRIFAMADVYVMPSVSEPFGIAPLEAMGHRVPVIISRNSGVSEILTHALKVDFWDVDDMASKIVAVLRYPPLRNSLRDHGLFEVRGITWDGAARRCLSTYARAIGAVARR